MDNIEYIVPFSIIKSYTPLENNDIDLKVHSFGKLKDGWDFGEGLAPSKWVIENTLMLFHFFERPFFEYCVTPTSSGGIKITCKLADNFLDITINKDLTVDLVREVGIGEDYDIVYDEKSVTIQEIESQINEILQQECLISEPYTSTNIIV